MWEVQHYTICDGLVNTWVTYEVDGQTYPTVYETKDEALFDLQDVVETANRDGMDYSYDDYRIVEVTVWPTRT